MRDSERTRRARFGFAQSLAITVLAAHFLAVQVAAQSHLRSVSEPLVIADPGMAATRSVNEDWARAMHAEFALDVVELGLTPASDIGVSRFEDVFTVATTMATAPMHDRPSPVYFLRRQVYSVELPDQTVPVAETDTIAGIDDDVVRLEIVTRFYDSFDEHSPKDTKLSGMRIRRLFEIEVAGLSDAIDALGDEIEPTQVADVFDRLGVSRQLMDQTITVEHPDGSIESGTPDDLRLSGFLGGGAGGDCVGNCLASIGAPIAIGLVSCLVAGTIGCGIACFFTAGLACVPCVAALVSGCGAIGGAAGPIGCILFCAFGGPAPPTATPTRRPSTPTPTPDRRAFSIEIDKDRVSTGGSVEVRWSASRQNDLDWVGLYNRGQSNNRSYLNFLYTRGTSPGTLTFAAPKIPGEYEFRILVNNGYEEPVPPRRASFVVAPAVAGDCNQDADVDVSDLIVAVNIALGRAPIDRCPSLDRDGSNRIEIGELIAAVQAAIAG